MTVWCAAALLAACHGDSNQPDFSAATHLKHGPPVKRGPTPEELTVGMVEAVPQGKSSAPVNLKFDLSARPVVGQSLEVTLAVMPQIVADGATLTATDSPALLLAPGFAPIEIDSVDPTQVYRHTLTVTPTQEGIQLLAVSIALKHDDSNETRAFSVPLIVASVADAAAAATASTGPSGGQ